MTDATDVLAGGVSHRLRLGTDFLSVVHVEGPVDVQLLVTHQVQMVPQCLLVVFRLPYLRIFHLHLSDDGFGTAHTFFLSGQGNSHIHHFLNLTTIFRQYQLFTLGVIV